MIIYNGDFYTATNNTSPFNAIAISADKIIELGEYSDISKKANENTELIDAAGLFVMPGFIEGHGHFHNMGKSLQNLNFLKDTSWNQIVEKVVEKAKSTEKGEWIYGRGWHQEKWYEQPDDHYGDYPKHSSLSQLVPDHPVILFHASGHSLFANDNAMKKVGMNSETPDPAGGKIVKDDNNQPIGVFEERAMTSIREAYLSHLESLNEEQQTALWYEAIELAEKECLENGITSFQDAGSKFKSLKRYEGLAENNKLDVRLWVMLRDSLHKVDGKISDYKKINFGNNFYTCRAIKSEIDGALGAHGAWLTEPYADKNDFYGQNTTPISRVESIAQAAFENGMQLCVHAIGDRANKETLDIIEHYNNKQAGLRWRVEHAQHLNPNDINRFKSTGAIASMQAVHCTSDAPFVVKRLGSLRSKVGAYVWKSLLDQDVVIVNGTDVPVEDINPIDNYYASVTRTRLDNGMRFFVEQRMSREAALRSYTIDAAYGAFEEDIKGSLEVGKLADITILDKNLLTCEDSDIPSTKIIYTIVGGETKYQNQ